MGGGGWPRLLSRHKLWTREVGNGSQAGLPITTDSASDSSLGATRPTFVHWGSFSGGRVGSHRTGSLLWGQRLAQLFYHTGPDPGDQTHTRCQTPIGDEQPPLASRASGDDSGADRTHQCNRRVAEIHQNDVRQLAVQVRTNFAMLFGYQLRTAPLSGGTDQPLIMDLVERTAPAMR